MKELPEKFFKPYDPQKTEERIYAMWVRSGYFDPDNVEPRTKNTFSIVLPPPNVTGVLHMGHAAMLAIEDTLVRYHRMKGDRTLWIPGTDHAAIATQSKVEKILQKEEKKTRHDLGRETFLRRVEKFARDSHDTIENQIRRLGASVDWSREAYTLDKKREVAVRTAFKNMYDEGLIERRYRIVNWDPKGQTTVSDEEVNHEPADGTLYTFKYSSDFPISIATTRPETKFGDTAVAVHPEDDRYKTFIGMEFDVPFCGADLHIKVIGDTNVDPLFGTGAVGVTPAHSFTDFEMSEQHALPMKQVINEFAKMVNVPHPFLGKKTLEVRKMVVDLLGRDGLLLHEERTEMNIAKAERSGGTIEPLPKLQWFVNVNKPFPMKSPGIGDIKEGSETTLKAMMREALSAGDIETIPANFEKTYFHFIDNLRDWCISRQLWFGHRIPVWYKNGQSDSDQEIYCGVEAPEGTGWEQDPDTLDTWFSSGLWTFSTLGWPEQTEDLKTFHPMSVLETGYDILFFWIARMILMSGFHLGEVPFHTIYLHGLVRDENGRKMSKSLGNTIDPLEMAEKYGADATRLSLLIGNPPGNDLRLSEDKVRAYKKFSNKIWNASRFVLSNLSDDFDSSGQPRLSSHDIKHLETLEEMTKAVSDDIENLRLYLAAEKLYHFFWHTFADIIIEEYKESVTNNNSSKDEQTRKKNAQWLLFHILEKSLCLLHPFLPFITEEIWSEFPDSENRKPLLITPWPIA